MTKQRRKPPGRPSKAYKDSLRLPKKADYDMMLQKCVEALLDKQDEVILIVSHLVKFPKDFPKGMIVRTEIPNVIRRVKVSRLMRWLKAKGYTQISGEQLGWGLMSLSLIDKELFNGLVPEGC